ncbi:MAG: 2-oxo acid dehydrogenase subunit E2 [Bacteroidia bacterium]|nr:MAG: 2-oxo acid dehydrogenase subunit E2 [Bacteroidia bacterium]
MALAVIMPRQGQSVESCILTEWYKAEGEQVSKGDLLFAYETDKAAFEEEAPVDGLLLARFFVEGDEVPVLQNVAVIGVEGESVEEFRLRGNPDLSKNEEVEIKGAPEEIEAVTPGPLGTVSDSQSKGRTTISPRARKLACKKRVVLDAIHGSGPGGRIIERDVLEAIRQGKRLTPLAQKKMEAEGLTVPAGSNEDCGRYKTGDLVEPAPSAAGTTGLEGTGSYTDTPLSNIRKIIAGAMLRSLQNSAQLTHHLSANASPMLELRRQVKARQKEGYAHNITLNDMVCFAVVRSLLLHPGANAHFLDNNIRQFSQVNLGLAVDTDRGLMVPSLLNADRLSLPGLSLSLKEMADKSKQGSISPDLLVPEAASFTVSNLGNYGVEMFTPVINLPQVAILGVNTIVLRPAVLPDGNFGFQPFMGLSLTYDHRALDGGPATLFLAEIKKQIESLSTDLL